MLRTQFYLIRSQLDAGVLPHARMHRFEIPNRLLMEARDSVTSLASESSLPAAPCPICLQGEPLAVVATLSSGWLTMSERAPMIGYACFVFRRHAVEVHDLSEAEATAFIHDLRRVSRAVAAATNALKLNYEIHGNTLPHLHVHIFPRYAGDRFTGRPIDPREVVDPVYGPGEFATMQGRVLASIAAGAA